MGRLTIALRHELVQDAVHGFDDRCLGRGNDVDDAVHDFDDGLGGVHVGRGGPREQARVAQLHRVRARAAQRRVQRHVERHELRQQVRRAVVLGGQLRARVAVQGHDGRRAEELELAVVAVGAHEVSAPTAKLRGMRRRGEARRRRLCGDGRHFPLPGLS